MVDVRPGQLIHPGLCLSDLIGGRRAGDRNKCGARDYPGITQRKIDLMIAELRRQGMTVTGANPWHVDTKQHGFKVDGRWTGGATRHHEKRRELKEAVQRRLEIVIVATVKHLLDFVVANNKPQLLDRRIGGASGKSSGPARRAESRFDQESMQWVGIDL